MRQIKQIVVHCTASPDYMDIGFKEIDSWHKDRGFKSPSGIHCGYHYIVRRNGTIERGRPDIESGAHAKGVNSISLGICWVGIKETTQIQYKALAKLLKSLMDQYNVDVDNVLGHNEAVETFKSCPNIDMNKLRAELVFKQDKVKVRRD